MKAAGFKILGNDECPIAPVYIGDAKLAGYHQYLFFYFTEYTKYFCAVSHITFVKASHDLYKL
jgi:hypothetical protein